MADVEALIEAIHHRAGQHCLRPEPGDYVEFIDENDPDAGVVLRRRDGRSVLWIATEDYRTLREAVACG